jgi:quercetin dioxygenase-like cupin family protein
MRTEELSRERPMVTGEATATLPEATPARNAPGRRGLAPVVSMAAGLLVVALAATVLLSAPNRGGVTSPPVPVATPAAADALALTLSARDVSIVHQVYEPGETSGWHSHSGVHAVAVLSGTLTVYDGQCQAQTFQAGQPYVGGQQLHLVRNESTEPVVMTVTYLSPASGGEPTRKLPAPGGCAS